MANTSMKKLTLSTALVRQYDALVQEEIGARYAYEMASSRPSSPEVDRDTAQYLNRLKQKQWELEQMEALVPRVTGLSLDELREVSDELMLVLGRREEVAAELRQRQLLTPALRETLYAKAAQGLLDAEESAALEKLEAALDDLPHLQMHLTHLDQTAARLAERIEYREVSKLARMPGLTVI